MYEQEKRICIEMSYVVLGMCTGIINMDNYGDSYWYNYFSIKLFVTNQKSLQFEYDFLTCE